MSHSHPQADFADSRPDDLSNLGRATRFRQRASIPHQVGTCQRARGQRRGVILLMMVIVLVLFSLVCVTWVITARQFREVSTASAAMERYDEGFEDLLDEAFMQVIRGSLNPYSAIGPHSLLEDKYGNDFVGASSFGLAGSAVLSTRLLADNQLTEITFSDPVGTFSPLNDYYNGRILTYLQDANPAVVGHSVRIVDYASNNSTNQRTFTVESFPTTAVSPAPPLPVTNAPFQLVINGREFNGRGFGIPEALIGGTPGFVPLQAGSPLIPFHPAGADPNATALLYDEKRSVAAGNRGYNAFGADESYDIPDYNNMILAGRVWDSTQGRWRVLIPSMHRPALLNFVSNAGAMPVDARNYMFRPSTDPTNGHPNFAVNNTQLSNAINALFGVGAGNGLAGPLLSNANLIAYDVDNDGDGEADSVWIDLGFPAQTAPDGRMYKPLFALLVEDLDSRLNVNHHGTQELAIEDTTLTYTQTHASATTPAPGLGEGPADVNLLTYLRAFENVAGQADASYNRLLYGSFANPLPSELQGAEGRYGELHRGVLSAFDLPAPGVNNVHDPYSAVVNHDYRNWRRRFGSPPDMRAINRLGVGVDGNMLHSSFSRLSPASFLGIPLDRDVQKDNPYEFNGSVTRKLFDGAGGLYYEDRPFTAAELEMLLRFRDADVSQVVNTPTVSNPTGLENRLLELMQLSLDPNTLNGRRVQGQLTTHSADSSAPNIRWTQDMLEAARTAQYLQDLIDAAPSPSIVDLLRFRIAQANGPGVDADQLTNASLVAGYGYLLAPDLLSGTRMDLNRPFGNNRDEVIGNSANGVIDEGHNLNMGAGPPPSPIPSAEPEITGEANTDGLVQTVYDLASEGADLIAAGLPGEAAKYSQFLNLQLTDANYDGVLGNRSHLARHDYARQLFCLMMVLKDPHFRFTDGSGLEPSDGAALPMIPNPTTRPPNYPTYLPEYTVQRLAQFCANSVDYLDRDSIMTAFEYDADPFTDNDGDGITWDVDGDIATQEPVETRRVVWGLEKPAMVLSETWAFHDNRTRDTEDEGGPGNGEFVQPLGADVDFDQTRMPQGSLFIELYCTVSGIVPAELRPQLGVPWRNTQRTPENVVDLSRLAPAPAVPDDPTTTTIDERAPHPVWRLIIGDRNQLISDSIDTNPVGSQRPTFDADLNALIQRGSSVQPLPSPAASDISRVVWLTSRDAYEAVTATLPTGPLRPEDAQDHVYYSDLQWANRPPANQVDLGNQLNWDFTDADTLEAEMRMFHVAPQQYAVIGPRVRTKIGHSWPDPATPDKTFETVIQLLDPRNPLTTPALQDALGFGRAKAPDIIFNDADSTTYVSPPWAANRVVRRPVGIVINGPRIDDGDGRARGRGLSISEPPPPALDVGNPSTVATYYNQPNSNPGPRTLDNFDEYTDPFDVPLDMPSEGGVSALLLQTDIYQDWQDESLFLQRLANPLVPYHPIYNPYITLDMMQLDLSVYNGEEDLAHPRQDPPRIAVSRQKTGELLIDGSLVPQQSHWGPVTAADYLGVSDARDNRVVLHSLGHVNGLYDGVGLNTSVVNDHFLTTGNSVVNEALSTDAVFGPSLAEHIALALAAETNPIADERIGDLQPFYLNILALAQEQTLSTFPTGPGGIFVGAAVGPNQERSPAFTWNNRPFISALDLLNVPGSPPDRLMRDFSVRGMTGTRYGDQLLNIAPFRHLFPFFQEFDPNPSAGLPTPPRSNFHHLFEYVHVPSRFPESQKVLTPAVSGTPVNFESLPLHPPFNKLSQFREPGKINLNNMQDTGEGFAAATNDEIDPAISDLAYNSVNAFRAMRQSRKGFGAIPGPAAPPEMDLEFNPAEPSFFARPFKGYSESDIDETYLRREPGGQQPLLAARTVTDPSPTGVKLGSNPVPPERDGDRHAYLRHEPFNKLGNIMTTRSNVYAVWITVGFFEVTPAPAAGGLSPSRELYPDGLMLGHELGLTDGSIVRHRMFGIIDRSRPTAFVRGFDYNAKETVLLKRIIE